VSLLCCHGSPVCCFLPCFVPSVLGAAGSKGMVSDSLLLLFALLWLLLCCHYLPCCFFLSCFIRCLVGAACSSDGTLTVVLFFVAVDLVACCAAYPAITVFPVALGVF
jgi:hypothetical protein